MENHFKASGKFANMKIQTGKPTPSSASVFPQQQRPLTSQSNQSLPLLLDINANFEEYSRYFKDPLPPLKLVDPLSYSELITLSRNLGSILKVVKMLEKDTSNKVNDLKRVNDKYLVDIEKENRELKQQNRNLKEELDQILTQKNKPTPLNSPKSDIIFYNNGVNFKNPNFMDNAKNCDKLIKENDELKEKIQYINKQLIDKTAELEKLKREMNSRDEQLKDPYKRQASLKELRENQELKERIQLLEFELRGRTSEIEPLEEKIKAKDEQLKEIQKRGNLKEILNQELKKKLELFDRNLKEKTSELEKLKEVIKSKDEQLKDAQKNQALGKGSSFNFATEQQTPKGNTPKGSFQFNNLLAKYDIKSRNVQYQIKNKPNEGEKPQETSKNALDLVEEIQLLKAQLISSQEEVTRLSKIIKEKDQPILRGRTSNIQKPQAAQVKQETTEIESELQKLKCKLDDRKAAIRSLTLEVQKEKDEKEDIKKRLSSSKRKYKREKEEKKSLEENMEAKEAELKRLRKKFESEAKPQVKDTKTIKNSRKPPKNAKPYDIVINIDSLKAREIGWKVEAFNDDDIDMKREYSVIGLVGPEKSGKTFLLNKLCDLGLPEKMGTKGLSVKYTDVRNLACLDSAGMQRPVEYFEQSMIDRYNGISREDIAMNQEIKQKMLNDRTLTDIFIQDFILESSEVILIVVGPLTQDDQKLIERISRKYKLKKKIVIVHNFANIWDNKAIEERIESDIKRAFHTIERNIPDSDIKEYIEKKQEKDLENSIHLVLGAENQDSGFKYNDVTIKYLQSILDTRTEKRNFNILNELKEFLKENYRLYLQFKKTPKRFDLKSIKNNEETVLIINTDQDYEASNPIFNSLGFMITNPPYEVFIRKNCYIVLIELPDLNLENLKFRLDKKKTEITCLIIEGNKLFASYGKGNNEAITGNRKCGEFTCVIPLGTGLLTIQSPDYDKDYDAGVLRIIVDSNEEEEEKL